MLAIVLVVAVVLGGSFFALHEGTGADLKGAVDDQLRADATEFARSTASSARTERQLERRARSFISGQGYHGDSRIFVVQVGDGRDDVVTNEPDALDDTGEEEGESPDGDDAAGGMLEAPLGYATIGAPDGGHLRVLSERVGPADAPIGTFRVAQSLTPIGDAQGSLRDTLLVVGIAAAVLLVVAALWIATLVTRPLSRIATFASDVEASGLDRRLTEEGGSAEIRSLTVSLNRMLDRLQAAFDREREFVADASHELRTPVTIAQGELDLLRRDADPGERERLEVVRRELKRMERLVAEMLTIASQDAEGALRHDRVDVSDLLSDLRRDAPLMGRRRYEIADLGGTVEADPDRLAQVFRNLVGNAVAHTAVDGLIAVAATAEGEVIRFDITDDGPGFSAAEAGRLFDRFYRTESSRSQGGSGSGLGLAIARSIVEAHGGRIWAEAGGEEGGGRVSFELPGYLAG
ncbi:MAG: HAMP domain-containing sensor histidine kinase [Solirubrobacterales bacterium]